MTDREAVARALLVELERQEERSEQALVVYVIDGLSEVRVGGHDVDLLALADAALRAIDQTITEEQRETSK